MFKIFLVPHRSGACSCQGVGPRHTHSTYRRQTILPCAVPSPADWTLFHEYEMSATTPVKTFSVPLSPTKKVDVFIAEADVRADNLNLTTWTSSFVLAGQLHKFNVRFEKNDNIPILELGAGTGLVGLTAAILWQKHAVLTDLPGILPGIQTNVKLNHAKLDHASTYAKCGTLDWKRAETLYLENGETCRANRENAIGKSKKADVILAADTIYDEDHPELLSNAILTWLARTESARAILCYPLRVCYLDYVREIWTILEEAGLAVETEGQERANTEDWDDECLCEWVVWKWKEAS